MLENAEDFVTAADALAGKNVAHVRYHLATLALEEIGKARIDALLQRFTFDEPEGYKQVE